MSCQHGNGDDCALCAEIDWAWDRGAAYERTARTPPLREILAWRMCSGRLAPGGDMATIDDWLDSESRIAGFEDWLDAYHRLPPNCAEALAALHAALDALRGK